MSNQILGSGKNIYDYYLYDYYLQKYYLSDRCLDAYYLDNVNNQKMKITEINNDLDIKNNIEHYEQFHQKCNQNGPNDLIIMHVDIMYESSAMQIYNVRTKFGFFSCITNQRKRHVYYVSQKVVDKIEDFLNNTSCKNHTNYNQKIRIDMKKIIPKINVICPHCKMIIILQRFCSKCGWKLKIYFLGNFKNSKIVKSLSDNGYIIAIPRFGSIIQREETSINIFRLPYNIHHHIWKNSSIYENPFKVEHYYWW
jgi:hypothetical protein